MRIAHYVHVCSYMHMDVAMWAYQIPARGGASPAARTRDAAVPASRREVIAACADGRGSGKACQLLETRLASKLPPNNVSCSSAFSTCEWSGDVDRAVCLLDKMTAGTVDPDVLSYSAAISTCNKTKQTGRAYKLIRDAPTN